jgi:hypothetical protein
MSLVDLAACSEQQRLPIEAGTLAVKKDAQVLATMQVYLYL